MTYPTCGSHDISKNGTTRRGKHNYKCRDCRRQFVEDPQWNPKDKDVIEQVNLRLLEKIPWAGIARVMQVSDIRLQEYVNNAYAQMATTESVLPKAKGKLTIQMDELWSFVDHKGNKQWVWLAIDADTREIIGCHVGDRSRTSAQQLWQFLPAVYRQCAKVYTDYWEAYETVIPSKRHFVVGKDSGLTSYIERLNNTMRQWVSRLVKKTLSFSKELDNHIGAIWTFTHEYNRLIRERLIKSVHPAISSVLY
ncbi:IS1 family transposase [Acaryochloris sp. IP29b_bin.137]|uniref:IS1 family transposase n=1 Tax=Acaryochloris sp. IP29b_bin.137 TaxID=2969217 RepID=UPI0026361296|nr:IS1 family transposase [Acaryochloris sp. IP29b_bin.137]